MDVSGPRTDPLGVAGALRPDASSSAAGSSAGLSASAPAVRRTSSSALSTDQIELFLRFFSAAAKRGSACRRDALRDTVRSLSSAVQLSWSACGAR